MCYCYLIGGSDDLEGGDKWWKPQINSKSNKMVYWKKWPFLVPRRNLIHYWRLINISTKMNGNRIMTATGFEKGPGVGMDQRASTRKNKVAASDYRQKGLKTHLTWIIAPFLYRWAHSLHADLPSPWMDRLWSAFHNWNQAEPHFFSGFFSKIRLR